MANPPRPLPIPPRPANPLRGPFRTPAEYLGPTNLPRPFGPQDIDTGEGVNYNGEYELQMLLLRIGQRAPPTSH